MERSGFPETKAKSSEQLFREWNEVDFPKLTLGFGFGKSAPLHSRNNCQRIYVYLLNCVKDSEALVSDLNNTQP